MKIKLYFFYKMLICTDWQSVIAEKKTIYMNKREMK